MRILALDIGDVWTGSAISDYLGITARPYKTVKTKELQTALAQIIKDEHIETILIGYPLTLKGTESDQTKKVKQTKETLEKEFNTIPFVLWSERLTSKQADKIKRAKTKEDKIQSHSIAAAVFLQTYLAHLAFKKNTE